MTKESVNDAQQRIDSIHEDRNRPYSPLTHSVRHPGLQRGSVGPLYPYTVSAREGKSSGAWYVWNMLTGREIVSFRYESLGQRRNVGQNAHRWIERWLPIAVDADNKARKAGGFSLNRNGDTPTRGYVVSLEGCELRVSAEDLDIDTILIYLGGRIMELSDVRQYFGGWTYHKEFFLDISCVMNDRNHARDFARLCQQKAIYDVKEQRTVYL